MLSSPAYLASVAQMDRDHDRVVREIVTLTEIPAPPFKEAKRAAAYRDMLKEAGLDDVEIDSEGNAMGLYRGTGAPGGPVVVLAAHLDTVFPMETVVKVRREGNRLYAPGIGDDTRSLAVLLAYARAMKANGVKTKQDILFVGNVGEEGPGDLRGVRYLLTKGKYKGRVKTFFSMDGTDAQRLVTGGVGSKRYRVTFKGPGGHSYGAFGLVNPMVAMSQTVVDFYKLPVPDLAQDDLCGERGRRRHLGQFDPQRSVSWNSTCARKIPSSSPRSNGVFSRSSRAASTGEPQPPGPRRKNRARHQADRRSPRRADPRLGRRGAARQRGHRGEGRQSKPLLLVDRFEPRHEHRHSRRDDRLGRQGRPLAFA